MPSSMKTVHVITTLGFVFPSPENYYTADADDADDADDNHMSDSDDSQSGEDFAFAPRSSKRIRVSNQHNISNQHNTRRSKDKKDKKRVLRESNYHKLATRRETRNVPLWMHINTRSSLRDEEETLEITRVEFQTIANSAQILMHIDALECAYAKNQHLGPDAQLFLDYLGKTIKQCEDNFAYHDHLTKLIKIQSDVDYDVYYAELEKFELEDRRQRSYAHQFRIVARQLSTLNSAVQEEGLELHRQQLDALNKHYNELCSVFDCEATCSSCKLFLVECPFHVLLDCTIEESERQSERIERYKMSQRKSHRKRFF